MRLSEAEIHHFLLLLRVSKPWGPPTTKLLNEIIKQFTINIPWQNLTMISDGLGQRPDSLTIKNRMFQKIGGICLDNNQFVYQLLSGLGYNVRYILCRRPCMEKTHLALVVNIEKNAYFVDCGDAQPYFHAFDLASRETIKYRSSEYKIELNNGQYQLLRKLNKTWFFYYEFDLTQVDQVQLDRLTQKYYSDIFFGPFWKAVHFACYPDQKLIAVKDHTIISEQKDGKVIQNHYSSIESQLAILKEKIPEMVYSKFNFQEAIIKLREINLLNRFGLSLSPFEVKLFLERIEINPERHSILFINRLIISVIGKIPFQNQTMLSKGFGLIPQAREIIDDMLNLKGGTCGTMNIFFGALLYSLGYETSLIQGRMQKEDDHIGILLNLNNQTYVIDIGDGQPFFQALATNQNIEVSTPFRTYKTITEESKLIIQFLIENKWATDSTFDLTPKSFKEIKKTLLCHYQDSDFGPFWKGVRFAMYPNKRLIAIRDRIFYLELHDLTISRIEIKNKIDLNNILDEYLPSHKESIIESFNKLDLL